MILGIVVFSLLFVIFVVFGTLLICGKGYAFISGYRGLTVEEKAEFISKNNLKKIFSFYSYYCFAISGVTLLALIGACCNSMVVIFISYLLFGAGTIATLIIVNANSNYKIVPIKRELPAEIAGDESKAVLVKNYLEARVVTDGVDEAEEVKSENSEAQPKEVVVEVKVEPEEETVVINKKTKTGTAKRTIANGSKPKTSATKTSATKSAAVAKATTTKKESTATKPAVKKETKTTTAKSTTSKPKTTTKSASASKSKTTK